MIQTMTPLRQRMIDDMTIRNLAVVTRQSYLRTVASFSAFHGRSPDQLTLEDVRDYQLHLLACGLKATSVCQMMSALRFFYGVTLDSPEMAARIRQPRRGDPLPAILSREEVRRLLTSVANPQMRALNWVLESTGRFVSRSSRSMIAIDCQLVQRKAIACACGVAMRRPRS